MAQVLRRYRSLTSARLGVRTNLACNIYLNVCEVISSVIRCIRVCTLHNLMLVIWGPGRLLNRDRDFLAGHLDKRLALPNSPAAKRLWSELHQITGHPRFHALNNVEVVLYGAGVPRAWTSFPSGGIKGSRLAGAMHRWIRFLLQPWDERGILDVTIESI